MNTYFATIYAKFYNEKLRDDWLMEHGVNQSIPKGPVTSYSQEYEADYRDSARRMQGEIVRLYDEGILTEEQAVKITGLSRIDVRKMAEWY